MTQEHELPAIAGNIDVTELMRVALERGDQQGAVESLERLVALQERLLDRQAARAHADALAEFQRACPPIRKSRTANVTGRSGGAFSYSYAPLDEIVRIVRPLLVDLGLSFSWDSESANGVTKTTCTLRHRDGHSTSASFAAPNGGSPAMSEQQKVASTLTYGERQSLVQVLGLVTTDDIDGADDVQPITEVQFQALAGLLATLSGAINAEKFRAFTGVDDLRDLPAGRYAEVEGMLRRKAGGQA